MVVGVKFCGGCNPMYDRGTLYKKIIALYPEYEFETADAAKEYDTLIVIFGCERACADVAKYLRERTIWVSRNELPEI